MKNRYVFTFLSLIVMFLVGCTQIENEQPPEATEEEVFDSGVLAIQSSPSTALVYIDSEFKGSAPLTLYNFPVGSYDVVIKKQGYKDFQKRVVVSVGRTEEIDASLEPIQIIEERKPTEELSKTEPKLTTGFNQINLSGFAMYYDFDNMLFTELRTEKTDVFSRKYDTYIHFTALPPASLELLDKPINEIKKEDCITPGNGVAQLYSKQTLCIKTAEGVLVAIGGIWETAPSELQWILLS